MVAELEPNQAAWLTSCKPISLHEGLAIVEVPDDFTRNQIEGRLRGQLEDCAVRGSTAVRSGWSSR